MPERWYVIIHIARSLRRVVERRIPQLHTGKFMSNTSLDLHFYRHNSHYQCQAFRLRGSLKPRLQKRLPLFKCFTIQIAHDKRWTIRRELDLIICARILTIEWLERYKITSDSVRLIYKVLTIDRASFMQDDRFFRKTIMTSILNKKIFSEFFIHVLEEKSDRKSKFV